MASLTARPGLLGKRLAAHLLRRSTFKVNPSKIDQYANMTATQAVDDLFNSIDSQFPDGPIWYGDMLPMFPEGGSYNDVGYSTADGSRITSTTPITYALEGWKMYEAVYDPSPRWKIIYWFNSIFSTFRANPLYSYFHWRLLYQKSFQDLKSLAVKVTSDNLMLQYLNNHQNTSSGLNENYAREFLELFTILKGDTVTVDDYTTYTEADITTAAEVLTGWRNNLSYVDPDTNIASGKAQPSLHIQTDKTFSHRFGNQVIAGTSTAEGMATELSEFVDMIFGKIETARSFVTKLYRFFVSDRITPDTESGIIIPLANDLFNNDYDHILVLKKLLKSVHFYDEDNDDPFDQIVGGKIKSPLELWYTSLNQFTIENRHMTSNPDAAEIQQIFHTDVPRLYPEHLDKTGFDVRGPLTVEGYPGFYQEPQYSKNWFGSNSFYYRMTIGVSLLRGKVKNTNTDIPYKLDMVDWVSNSISVPDDANILVLEALEYLLPEMPGAERFNYFKEALLGGLSIINWHFAWLDFQVTDVDVDVRIGVERLYNAIITSPEFQTF